MLVSKHRAPVGALRQLGLGLVRERGEVSKHRAPVGALRPEERGVGGVVLAAVSKHRAPVGALRRIVPHPAATIPRQQAPRTGRCIKTDPQRRGRRRRWRVSKHRAPVGALRHRYHLVWDPRQLSASTTHL